MPSLFLSRRLRKSTSLVSVTLLIALAIRTSDNNALVRIGGAFDVNEA